MAGNRTPCLFCGATGVKLTREHVYPRWLQRAMNLRGDMTISSAGKVVRVAKELDIQLRDVCDGCNGGWMHDLERAFRAAMIWAINGYPTDMPEPIQRVVAVWAVKTWLLVERALRYARGDGEVPLITPAYYDWLRTHREPPPLTQVWIGAVDAQPPHIPETERPISIVSDQWVGHPPERLNGLVGVFTIGYVLFLIYNPVHTSDDFPPMGLGIGGRLGTALTQIWPHQVEVVRWPPARVLTVEEVYKLWPDGGTIIPGGSPPKDDSEAA